MMATKDKIKANNTDAKMTDYAKIAGELWRNLSDDEKEQWRQEALKRAIENNQTTSFDYLHSVNPDKRKKALVQLTKLNNNNPEENPGYTSSLHSD